MFADLANSTVLSGRLDPEDLRATLLSYYSACATAVERHGGLVGKWLGDGMLAYFSFPSAHDDDAQRAVRAGLEIVAWADRQAPVDGVPIVVRVGLHTGLCVVGEMGSGERVEHSDVVGETPSIASRVQSSAPPNGVAMSETTARLVRGFFVAEDLGMHDLKGVARPMRLWRVHAETGAHTRVDAADRLASMVGRGEETELLLDLWARAARGHGRAVLVSGEPGIGKSRLARALHDEIPAQHLRVVLHASQLHQGSALFPLVEHLRRQLDAGTGSPQERMDALVAEAGLDRGTALPLLSGLVGVALPADVEPLELTPLEHKERTFAVVLEWLRAAAARLPVLLIVEDLHWLDPSTLELLGRLLEQLGGQAMFVVLTARPEFEPTWPPQAVLSTVPLGRLSRLDSLACMRELAGGRDLPAVVAEEILVRTDGVPLFLEELTKTVLESDLVRDVDGRLVLDGALPRLAIPDTLHDSLMARLDRLGPAKDLAQLGATIGREFSFALISAVSVLEPDALDGQLDLLVASGLVNRRGIDPDAPYVFKHALIQDAAYESLLRSTRQQLHARVADALKADFPDLVRLQPEVLAQHLEQAGRPSDAIGSWQAAYHNAMDRSASMEALGYLERIEALIALFDDPNERAYLELGVRLWEAVANMPFRGYATDAVGRPAARAAELAAQVGNADLQRLSLLVLYAHYHVRGEHTTALDIGQRHDEMCVATGDDAAVLSSDSAVTGTYTFMGRNDRALQHIERGRRIYDELVAAGRRPSPGVNDPGVVVRCYQAQVLWRTGWPDRAVAVAQEALAIAHEINHPYSIGWGNCFAGEVHELRGDWKLSEHFAMANVELEKHDPFPLWTALGWAQASFARLMQGGPPELADTMAEHIRRYNDTNSYLGCTYLWGLQALAYLATARYDDGFAIIDVAEKRVAEWGERYTAAELPRIRGELILASEPDRIDDAKACFEDALALARDAELHSFELRAATSLAQALIRQEAPGPARAVLVPVLGWFTEGFDSGDLRGAREVVDLLDRPSGVAAR